MNTGSFLYTKCLYFDSPQQQFAADLDIATNLLLHVLLKCKSKTKL